jgi:hypothetical protein
MKNFDYRDAVVSLLVVLVLSLIYSMSNDNIPYDNFDKTEQTISEPTISEPIVSKTVQEVQKEEPHEKTVEEDIVDLESAIAGIVAKKVSKNLPDLDIKSNVSKDGWGISVKDTRKGEYNINVGHGKDGYELDAVDKRDGFSINIGK